MFKKAAVAVSSLAILCLVMGAAPFKANRWSAQAKADPELGENRYTVQFPPELGGEFLEMPIVSGTYEIRFEADRGRARLTEWRQDVGPIEILGMSTGPITITLDQRLPRTGTYDADGGDDGAGSVELRAGFKIEFDDTQLREFGLTSPMIMPATETGTLSADGVLMLTSEGVGSLQGAPLVFSCRSTTKLKNIKFHDDEPQPRRATDE